MEGSIMPWPTQSTQADAEHEAEPFPILSLPPGLQACTLQWLDPPSLLRIGATWVTCVHLRTLSHAEELWENNV